MGASKAETVGERLLQERREHGHTQAQLAVHSGRNSRTISRYELNESLTDADFLICLAKLNYDVHFILWGERLHLPLSTDETTLIRRYRQMNTGSRLKIQIAVDTV